MNFENKIMHERSIMNRKHIKSLDLDLNTRTRSKFGSVQSSIFFAHFNMEKKLTIQPRFLLISPRFNFFLKRLFFRRTHLQKNRMIPSIRIHGKNFLKQFFRNATSRRDI